MSPNPTEQKSVSAHECSNSKQTQTSVDERVWFENSSPPRHFRAKRVEVENESYRSEARMCSQLEMACDSCERMHDHWIFLKKSLPAASPSNTISRGGFCVASLVHGILITIRNDDLCENKWSRMLSGKLSTRAVFENAAAGRTAQPDRQRMTEQVSMRPRALHACGPRLWSCPASSPRSHMIASNPQKRTARIAACQARRREDLEPTAYYLAEAPRQAAGASGCSRG